MAADRVVAAWPHGGRRKALSKIVTVVVLVDRSDAFHWLGFFSDLDRKAGIGLCRKTHTPSTSITLLDGASRN